MGFGDNCFVFVRKRTEKREKRIEKREKKKEIREKKSLLSSLLSLLFSLFSLLFFLLFSPSAHAQQHSPFQVTSSSPSLSLNPGEAKTLSLQIKIPPNYFIYRDKTNLKFIDLKGLEIQTIHYPPSKKRQDPFFNKVLDVYENAVPIEVVLKAPPGLSPGPRIVEGLLTLQGCSDVLCYPEENHLVSFHLEIGSGSTTIQTEEIFSSPPPSFEGGEASLWELAKAQNFSEVIQRGWWIVLAVVFLGGFLTSLTPCVLPVIPVTLLIIGVRGEAPVRRNFILSSVLVLGLALMYAFLGVLAVSFGKGLGFVFQQKWFVLILALLFFVLSLSMFGLFEIHLPQRLAGRLNQIKGHGMLGAFASGMAAGVLAAPCAGPVVGALLLYVATTQSYFQGFGLLFVYALGMGLLFIVLGTGYGTLEVRFKNWRLAVWAKRFLGLLLLLGSLFYLNTIFPFQKAVERVLKPSAPIAWLSLESEGLVLAKKENKVMLIDFYADWCAPCKELELGFFRKTEVVALLKQMIPVRIDATFNGDPEVLRVLKKYNVIGWPTIAFAGPDGKILEDLTVISYNPELLLENMQRASVTRDIKESLPPP